MTKKVMISVFVAAAAVIVLPQMAFAQDSPADRAADVESRIGTEQELNNLSDAAKEAEKAPDAKAPEAKAVEAVPEETAPEAKPVEKAPDAKAPEAKHVETVEAAKKPAEEEKKPAPKTVEFGIMAVWEGTGGINAERPEYAMSLAIAPQLKFKHDLNLALRFTANYAMLGRMENSYDWVIDDFILEFTAPKALSVGSLKTAMFNIGAAVRYYVPVSWNSRQADSLGQFRGILKLSLKFWKMYLGAEANGQYYMNKYYATNLNDSPNAPDWVFSMGSDEFVENNTWYGFGQTFIVGITPVDGLDVTFSWANYQSRRYDLSNDPMKRQNNLPGEQFWSYSWRFVTDVTYSFGELPAVKNSYLKDTLLSSFAVSVGYFCFAPQLQNGGRTTSFNPFDPKYGQFYIDLAIAY
ncbi:MAG: hypothetical protein WC889_09875 [Myxococcota bacterium]